MFVNSECSFFVSMNSLQFGMSLWFCIYGQVLKACCMDG